jgi:hypothetical protein
MNNPIEYEMLAKIQRAEFLKAAAEQRAAKIARGDTPQPVARWWMAVSSLAVLAVGLAVLAGRL